MNIGTNIKKPSQRR